jgi:Flp pilus assembly protein TadD
MILLSLALALAGGCASTDGERGVRGGKAAASGDPADVPPAALTLYEQATAFMAAGDYVEAELRFKEFLLQYPQFSAPWVNLAIIYSNNEDDEAAHAAIDEALALEPENAVALNQLGMLLRRNGKFLEAEAAYLKAVTVSPEYALAHYNLGVLNELYLQRLEPALRHFERYQQIVGGDEQVERWIVDLRRRVEMTQQTANIKE